MCLGKVLKYDALCGFLFTGWALHYFPFFLMSRQLFIHHYLPSHLASALVAGSVLQFILSETINYPLSIPGPPPRMRLRARTWADLGLKGPITVGVFAVFMFALFVYMSPLTYGTPGYVIFISHCELCAD